MSYAVVNPVDRYTAQGLVSPDGPLPRTLGGEGAGAVDGRPVLVAGSGLGATRNGTWSQQAVVPRQAVLDLPRRRPPAGRLGGRRGPDGVEHGGGAGCGHGSRPRARAGWRGWRRPRDHEPGHLARRPGLRPGPLAREGSRRPRGGGCRGRRLRRRLAQRRGSRRTAHGRHRRDRRSVRRPGAGAAGAVRQVRRAWHQRGRRRAAELAGRLPVAPAGPRLQRDGPVPRRPAPIAAAGAARPADGRMRNSVTRILPPAGGRDPRLRV